MYPNKLNVFCCNIIMYRCLFFHQYFRCSLNFWNILRIWWKCHCRLILWCRTVSPVLYISLGKSPKGFFNSKVFPCTVIAIIFMVMILNIITLYFLKFSSQNTSLEKYWERLNMKNCTARNIENTVLAWVNCSSHREQTMFWIQDKKVVGM